MDKKGFIYVMTNSSMPGLLKVGMTSKNPKIRALDKDMNTTGVPTPWKVQYYAWFDDTALAESIAHDKLEQYHHAKEYFKTDIATAIIAIESINISFKKLYSKPDDDAKIVRVKAEKEAKRKKQEEVLRLKKQAEELEQKRLAEETQRLEKINSGIAKHKDKILRDYEYKIEINFTKPSFYLYLIVFSPITFTIMKSVMIYPEMIFEYHESIFTYSEIWMYLVPFSSAALIAYFLKTFIERRQNNSPKMKSFIDERDTELELIHKTYKSGKALIKCPDCFTRIRVPINKNLIVHCPECDLKFKVET